MRNLVWLLVLSVLAAGCTLVPREEDEPYWASGRVIGTDGAGLGGVHLVVESVGSMSTSAADGTWVLGGLRGAVTIVPQKDGYTFHPPSYTISRAHSGLTFTAYGADEEPEYNPCLDPALLLAMYTSGLGLLDFASTARDLPKEADVQTQPATSIMGAAVATRAQATKWLSNELAKRGRSERWVELVDMYYDIAPLYSIRADVALSQAVLETGYFGFGGDAQPWQNNFAGIGVTGVPSDGPDDPKNPLNGADPNRVCFRKGIHGAIFSDRATGVEAQIQHLYAYATTQELPAGAVLVDPRFRYVRRGAAPTVEELSGRWATDPGYGAKILAILSNLLNTV